MVVTHSPGNPFAFSPANRRAPAFDEADAFQYYKSPFVKPSPSVQRRPSLESTLRSAYAQKEYEENVEHEKLLKDARIEELEKQVLEEGKKLERAESDKRWLYEKEQKQAVEIAALKEELASSRKNADASMRDLRLSYNKLRDAQLSSEDKQRSDEQTRGRQLERMTIDMESQRRALSTLRADLTLKSDMLAEKNQRIEDLEHRLEQQSDAKVPGSPEELAFVTKELAQAIAKMTSMESTMTSQMTKIHRLQEANASIAVLKEEKATLETKIKAMDRFSEELAAAQVKLAHLEQERSAWTDLLGDGEISDVSAILRKQKRDAESLSVQKKLLEEQLEDSNTIISQIRQELGSQATKLDESYARCEAEKRLAARLERSKALGAREIKFLREQLASYDLEEQVESPAYDALKTTRIAELEKMVDELRQQIAETNMTTPTAEEDAKVTLGTKRAREEAHDFNEIERGEYLRKIRSLNADLEITRKEDALLRKEMETLKSSLQFSSTSASLSPSSSTGSRILQYKNNPTANYHAVRSSTLHDLKVENEALLAELSSRGAAGSSSSSNSGVITVPIQSLRNAESELRKSADVVRQKEKMIARLKQVFSAKSSEFREAVYSLLGYKLDFLPNGRVRLTSMYAENMDHAFVFDDEAGTMQLSGERHGNEAFMDALGNLIKYWSGEKNSIPGMLSALTLELLDKQGNSADGMVDGARIARDVQV